MVTAVGSNEPQAVTSKPECTMAWRDMPAGNGPEPSRRPHVKEYLGGTHR
jgi:hypothetical protein